MEQYNSRAPIVPIGDEDPLEAISIVYEKRMSKKQDRLDSQIASLKLKRRTKF